jgi:hypothetical protein
VVCGVGCGGVRCVVRARVRFSMLRVLCVACCGGVLRAAVFCYCAPPAPSFVIGDALPPSSAVVVCVLWFVMSLLFGIRSGSRGIQPPAAPPLSRSWTHFIPPLNAFLSPSAFLAMPLPLPSSVLGKALRFWGFAVLWWMSLLRNGQNVTAGPTAARPAKLQVSTRMLMHAYAHARVCSCTRMLVHAYAHAQLTRTPSSLYVPGHRFLP